MKKVFTLIAMALVAMGANAQTWNFSEWEQGDITETKTVDGLTVYATADKKVTIDANKKTYNDVEYTQRLKFGGTGSGPDTEAPSRFLQFDLPAGASVSIIATSASSSDDRTLNLATETFDNISATVLCVGGELVELTYTNEGDATTAFVYSAKSGINLYAIYVTGGKTPDDPVVQPGDLVIDPALPITFDDWSVSFLIQKTDVKAGDKFVFHVEAVDVDGWEWGAQVLPKSNADWNNLGDALIPDADGLATFEVTDEYAAVINGNGGLRVQGMGCKVTAVDYVSGGGGELVIDPALPITFDTWDANFLIQKTGVKAGDKFVFDIETVEVDGWQWGPQVLPKSNSDGWNSLGDAVVPDASGKGTFTLTEAYAEDINANGGLRVQGMGCRVTAVEFVEGVDPSTVTKEEFDLTQGWGTWNGSESIDYNADGTLTFHSVAWGGLSKWLGGVDWSAYKALVFEYAEPTTVATQAFVQYANEDAAGSTNATQWADAGVTSVSIDLDERKNAVNQFALQAADVSTIVVKAIYLTKEGGDNAIRNMEVETANDNAIYNLAGQKVNESYKGVVIRNGKKFIQK